MDSLNGLVVTLTFLALGFTYLSATAPNKDWNGLIATFDQNLSNPFAFNGLPRTVADAEAAGWEQDTSTGSCDDGSSYFRGNRYTLNDDPAAMLLYGVNGYIAGMQVAIPSGGEFPANSVHADYYYNETDKWVSTVYFIDPTKICSTGRTLQEYTDEGTGTELYLQTGQTPSSVMTIPRDATEASENTSYEKGFCVTAMGYHYWYDLSEGMDCKDVFPIFALYQDDTMVAFGWSFNELYSNSDRWEHPVRPLFSYFMQTVPTCFGADGPVTTLHIYLTNAPAGITCPGPTETTLATTTSSAPKLQAATLLALGLISWLVMAIGR